MSRTYIVTFEVVAPEGFLVDPYPFDPIFDVQGAEVVSVNQEEVEDDA